MGQQHRVTVKRKRRLAYHARKKASAIAAKPAGARAKTARKSATPA